jgi:hypothetical protein
MPNVSQNIQPRSNLNIGVFQTCQEKVYVYFDDVSPIGGREGLAVPIVVFQDKNAP